MGADTKYPISKTSVQKIKHSLIELHILKKHDAEETFTDHFLVMFLCPTSVGLLSTILFPYF